ASVNSSHCPRACCAPAYTAFDLPLQPSGSGPASTSVTPANERAMSAVRSVEPSSTTMISNDTPCCPASDSRHPARQASSLRAGTITDTSGRVDDGSDSEGRILIPKPSIIGVDAQNPGLVCSGLCSGPGAGRGLQPRLAARSGGQPGARFHRAGCRPQGRAARPPRQGRGVELLGHLVSTLRRGDALAGEAAIQLEGPRGGAGGQRGRGRAQLPYLPQEEQRR